MNIFIYVYIENSMYVYFHFLYPHFHILLVDLHPQRSLADCWGRWANPSTQKPGDGTTVW